MLSHSATSNVGERKQYQYYKLIIAYDGTRFHGSQRQIDNETMMRQYHNKKQLANLRPKKRPQYYDIETAAVDDDEIPSIRKGCNISVQEVLEFVLLDLYHPITAATVHEINLKFAGRTDKGVHANGQVCLVRLPHCSDEDTQQGHDPAAAAAAAAGAAAGAGAGAVGKNKDGDSSSSNSTSYYDYHCWKLRNDLNSRLPADISVRHVSQLQNNNCKNSPSAFDPRRDVTLKQYTYTIRYRRRNDTTPPTDFVDIPLQERQQQLQRMIDKFGGPHSIRDATTDSHCLWIVPWSLCNDSTIIPQLCQQFMGTEKDFYNFIHKADRDNPNKTTMHTIHEMFYEIINVSKECISTPNSSIMVSSDIVTGRLTFVAKSFRRTMIRNIVGYCIDVCRGGDIINNNNCLSTAQPLTIESLLRFDKNKNSTTEAIGNATLVVPNDSSNGIKEDDDENRETTTGYHHRQRPQVIINAAPASGLCLECVTY